MLRGGLKVHCASSGVCKWVRNIGTLWDSTGVTQFIHLRVIGFMFVVSLSERYISRFLTDYLRSLHSVARYVRNGA